MPRGSSVTAEEEGADGGFARYRVTLHQVPAMKPPLLMRRRASDSDESETHKAIDPLV
jgi:hypothetical protein